MRTSSAPEAEPKSAACAASSQPRLEASIIANAGKHVSHSAPEPLAAARGSRRGPCCRARPQPPGHGQGPQRCLGPPRPLAAHPHLVQGRAASALQRHRVGGRPRVGYGPLWPTQQGHHCQPRPSCRRDVLPGAFILGSCRRGRVPTRRRIVVRDCILLDVAPEPVRGAHLDLDGPHRLLPQRQPHRCRR